MSSKTLVVLGRQPAISIAELESLYGADKITNIGIDSCALLDLPHTAIDSKNLGGTIKTAKLLTILDTTNWVKISDWLIDSSPKHQEYLPEGKLQLGISVIGQNINPKQITSTGLELKKAFRQLGRSVRLVPNKTPLLSSAQVIHNNLCGPLGWELVFVITDNKTYVAQTTYEQDISSYSSRDQTRPKRDALVGMLPPKLAQIIINLAVDNNSSTSTPLSTNKQKAVSSKGFTILDPFCGTGVVLQEALLMGFSAQGSDIEPRMIDYTNHNIEWLNLQNAVWETKVADATTHTWDHFDTIACETYLGKAFSAPPNPDILSKVMHDVDTIHRKFLTNVARQTKTGFRMCLALPAWHTKNGFKHLKVLDSLEKLGYTRLSFVHVNSSAMVYHRPGQITARELVILVRK